MVPCDRGVVYAKTDALARRVGQQLDRAVPFVLAMLPNTAARDIEVWVLDETWADDESGFMRHGDAVALENSTGRIRLREGAPFEGNELQSLKSEAISLFDFEGTLVHECAHLILPDDIRQLSGALEEGLVRWVAARWHSSQMAKQRARSAMACIDLGQELVIAFRSAGFEQPMLEMTYVRANEQDFIDRADVVRVLEEGRIEFLAMRQTRARLRVVELIYALIDRVSERKGLRALWKTGADTGRANAGAVSPGQQLLADAGLAGDGECWTELLAELIGAPEARLLVDALQSDAYRTLALQVWRLFPALRGSSAAHVLRQVALFAEVGPRRVSVRLVEVPGFGPAFELAWDRLLESRARRHGE